MTVTLMDVAYKAGVSIATVSRVVNNKGYVSEKTKTKVQEAVAELGYIPCEAGRALRSTDKRK